MVVSYYKNDPDAGGRTTKIRLGARRGGKRLGKMLSMVGLNRFQAHRKWGMSGTGMRRTFLGARQLHFDLNAGDNP